MFVVYPAGTPVSVAVQSGSPVKPETVNTPGTGGVSLTTAEAGRTVPLVQETLTVTVPAARSGTKSLLTVKVAVLSVFVIVQLPGAVPLHVPAGEPLAM